MSVENEKELVFGGKEEEREPVPEGEYEVAIASINKTPTSTGKEQLKFKFKIREDVDQGSKGRFLFYNIVRKDGDGATFNHYRINQVFKAVKGDEERRFENLDEVLLFMMGGHLRVYTTVEESNTGKLFNSVDGDTFKPSKWDTEEHEEEVKGENLEGLDIPEDGLPF